MKAEIKIPRGWFQLNYRHDVREGDRFLNCVTRKWELSMRAYQKAVGYIYIREKK